MARINLIMSVLPAFVVFNCPSCASTLLADKECKENNTNSCCS